MSSGTRTGIFFGATSGVITTLGLIVGLSAGTESLVAVIGGILIIAVADALSDALGIHLALEADSGTSAREVWVATFTTLAAKFLTAITFVLPFLLMPLHLAIWISVIWGYLIITVLSLQLARAQQASAGGIIAEHVVIATFVVLASHAIGVAIRAIFGS